MTLVAVACLLALVPQSPQPAARDLHALLAAEPAKFGAVLAHAHEYRLQILLGEPFVDDDGRVRLRHSSLGDARQYFYPASSVKLGAAIVALLELQRLAAEAKAPFDLDAEWTIHRRFASDAAMPEEAIPIRRDLRRLFLVSDNAAFNHCFELVGPRRLNDALWQAGFTSARIWHRLSEPHPLAENRVTRAVTLRQGDAVLEIAARDEAARFDATFDSGTFDNAAFTDLDVGSAHMRDDVREDGPMSFAQKNAIALLDLQCLLAAVVRPEIDTSRRGFPELGVAARAFAVQALGELPRESKDPVYDPKEHPDHGCKFVLPGIRRVVPPEYVRVYDKIGRAYGFTIENAYVEDLRSGRGFFLAAVLYTNSDGVVGDDVYDFAQIADPFFADLGEVIARAVFGKGPAADGR
jgi:hypothetical protein